VGRRGATSSHVKNLTAQTWWSTRGWSLGIDPTASTATLSSFIEVPSTSVLRVHSVSLVWMGGMTYCIRLVREKLRIFPHGQIIGNVVLLAFWRYRQVQDRSGGWGETYKNVTPFLMDFPHTPKHAVHGAIASLSLAGVYCAGTLLGRRVCKRVDVYMITEDMLQPLLQQMYKMASHSTDTSLEISSPFVSCNLLHQQLSAILQTRPRSDTAAVGLSKNSKAIQTRLYLSFCWKFFHGSVSSKS